MPRLVQTISGRVTAGHGVASGRGGDPRFPGGSIRMQIPHFRTRGLDLGACHPATINVSIAPLGYELIGSDFTFRQVAWHPTEPAEDFSFLRAELRIAGPPEGEWTVGWIYHPHPETKPEHFQSSGTLEFLLDDFVEGVAPGAAVDIRTDPTRIRILEPEAGD